MAVCSLFSLSVLQLQTQTGALLLLLIHSSCCRSSNCRCQTPTLLGFDLVWLSLRGVKLIHEPKNNPHQQTSGRKTSS